MLTSPSRRVLGALAAGTVGLSTALLGITGVAQADTGAPAEGQVAASLSVPNAPTDFQISGVGDGSVGVWFRAGAYDPAVQDATTGYQISTDGGTTWTALTVQGDNGLTGTVSGLTNGQSYQVEVRAQSGTGPSAATAPLSATPAKPIGAPGNVVVTTSPGKATVSWSAPTTTGTYPIDGYSVAFFIPETDNGGGAGGQLCQTTAAVHTCTGDLDFGGEWQITVNAVDTQGNPGDSSASVPTGKIPYPTAAPPADGPMTPAAGSSDKVVAGKTMVVSGSGYQPGSTVTVLIYSSPQVLTTVVADGSGNFTATVTVPAGLEPGQHTLVGSGVDPGGVQRFVTLPVTVSAAGVATISKTKTGTLAYTGVDVLPPALAGLAAIALGTGLIVLRRRAARSAA